jgi:signal peptidase II
MMPWVIALLFLVIDQISKWLIVKNLREGQMHGVIPHLLDWVFVENTRGAYGLFGDRPWFLIAIALLAFGAIWLAFRDRAQKSPAMAIALGVVLGGAIGNVLDRLHYGFVVDFIRIVPMPFFEVFNIADSGILVGILTIIYLSLRTETAA